jgi:uncharacterized repeat protein (TIGR03943 family)
MKSLLSLKSFTTQFLLPTVDILAILAWGLLMLRYSFSGELRLLVHPNYFGLVTMTGVVLVGLSVIRGGQWLKRLFRKNRSSSVKDTVAHITLLPVGLGSALLLITAILAFVIPPTAFNSQVALQRGISNTLPATQIQAESFAANIKPEERSLIDWIRTINAYPEPDAYAGQKAKIRGFVVYSPNLPDNYLLLSRFILTCCAVDAYPVGLPVKLTGSRQQYPQDGWLEIQGEMITETLPNKSSNSAQGVTNKRQVVLKAQSIKAIPTPADPYSY